MGNRFKRFSKDDNGSKREFVNDSKKCTVIWIYAFLLMILCAMPSRAGCSYSASYKAAQRGNLVNTRPCRMYKFTSDRISIHCTVRCSQIMECNNVEYFTESGLCILCMDNYAVMTDSWQGLTMYNEAIPPGGVLMEKSDVDGCAFEDACYNGGTCVDGLYSVTCLCTTGYRGNRCTVCTAIELIGSVTEYNSYYTYGPDQWPWVLTHPTRVNLRSFELTLKFKSMNPTGILFFAENAPSTTDAVKDDFLGAYMENGYIKFVTLTSSSKGLSIATTTDTYNDGIWHSAVFNKRGDFVDLCVDGSCSTGAASSGDGNKYGQTNISPWFYFGGVSSELSAKAQKGLTLTADFIGCIADITVKGQDGGLPAAMYNTKCCS